jgi:hypothetical protein
VILLIASVETAAGTPDFGFRALAPLSSHTPVEIPAAGNSIESQTATPTAGT